MDRITVLYFTMQPNDLLSYLGEWSNNPERDNPLSHMESVGTLRRVAGKIGVDELAAIVDSSAERMRAVVESPCVPDDLNPRVLLRLGRKAFGRRVGAMRKGANG